MFSVLRLIGEGGFVNLFLQTFEFDLERGAGFLLFVEFTHEVTNLVGELRLHVVQGTFHLQKILVQLFDRRRAVTTVRMRVYVGGVGDRGHYFGRAIQ